MSEPQPYDLSSYEEFQRLMKETLAYMKVSRNDGTDRDGREYAITALSHISMNWKPIYKLQRQYRKMLEFLVILSLCPCCGETSECLPECTYRDDVDDSADYDIMCNAREACKDG